MKEDTIVKAVTINHKIISELLEKFITNSNGMYHLNDGGYVCNEQGPLLFAGRGEDGEFSGSHKLVLYNEKIEDVGAHILNPFSENIRLSLEKEWFYESLLASTTSMLLIKIMSIFIEFALSTDSIDTEEEVDAKSKKTSKKNTKKVDLNVKYPLLTDIRRLTLLSHIDFLGDSLSAATVTNFNKISAVPQDFFSFKYLAKMTKAVGKFILTDPIFKTKYPTVSAKNVESLTSLLYVILGIGDIKELFSESKSIICPKFETMTDLYLRVHARLEKFIYLVYNTEEEVIAHNNTIQFFREVLPYCEQITQKSSWLVALPTDSDSYMSSKTKTPLISLVPMSVDRHDRNRAPSYNAVVSGIGGTSFGKQNETGIRLSPTNPVITEKREGPYMSQAFEDFIYSK